MKNTIKWALPVLFIAFMASCSFFKSSEQPQAQDSDAAKKDTVTQVIENDTLPETPQDSVGK